MKRISAKEFVKVFMAYPNNESRAEALGLSVVNFNGRASILRKLGVRLPYKKRAYQHQVNGIDIDELNEIISDAIKQNAPPRQLKLFD